MVGSSNQIPSTILWEIAGQWLQTGWLQTRAREKPLGYAGDYALLEAIINERVRVTRLDRFLIVFSSGKRPRLPYDIVPVWSHTPSLRTASKKRAHTTLLSVLAVVLDWTFAVESKCCQRTSGRHSK